MQQPDFTHIRWFVDGGLVKTKIDINGIYSNYGSFEYNDYASLDFYDYQNFASGVGKIYKVKAEIKNEDISNPYYTCMAVSEIPVVVLRCHDNYLTTSTYNIANGFTNSLIVPFYPYVFATDFYLNGSVNGYIQSNPTILAACHEIILDDGFETGNLDFIAGGNMLEECNSQHVSSKLAAEETVLSEVMFSIYPNPFSIQTKFFAALTEDGLLSIELYNIIGEKVATLVNKTYPKGEYVFTFENPRLQNGIYTVLFKHNNYQHTEKLVKTSDL